MWRRICGKWLQKVVDREEWASVIKDVRVLRGLQWQGVSKKGIVLNFIFLPTNTINKEPTNKIIHRVFHNECPNFKTLYF